MSNEPRDPKIPDLVSATEAAAMLVLTKPAVLKRAERGQLLGARAGTTWVFRRSVVEAAMSAKQDRPHPASGEAGPVGGE